jgi:SAM-dependent methyltransferase
MAEVVDFTERYLRGETPWDSDKPSEELLRALHSGKLTGKTVLEFGCGTGTNAVELARQGFHVTAVDIAAPAIRTAGDKAHAAGVTVDFRVADVLQDDLGGPYDILFDRGVYHYLRTIDLKRLQKFLQKSTRAGSWWLSLAGNAKEDTDPGPPVVTENEIHGELGPLFEIVELREFRFRTNKGDFRPLAWSILMRRR